MMEKKKKMVMILARLNQIKGLNSWEIWFDWAIPTSNLYKSKPIRTSTSIITLSDPLCCFFWKWILRGNLKHRKMVSKWCAWYRRERRRRRRRGWNSSLCKDYRNGWDVNIFASFIKKVYFNIKFPVRSSIMLSGLWHFHKLHKKVPH